MGKDKDLIPSNKTALEVFTALINPRKRKLDNNASVDVGDAVSYQSKRQKRRNIAATTLSPNQSSLPISASSSSTTTSTTTTTSNIPFKPLANASNSQAPMAPFFKKAPEEIQFLTTHFLPDADAYKIALLNKSIGLHFDSNLQDRKLIALITAIMMGDPEKVKAIVRGQPDLLFKEWKQPITDPSGRQFMPTTAFKLMLWLREPMRDEVLACIPNANDQAQLRFKIDKQEQINKQKLEFMEKGITYKFRDEAGKETTVPDSKGYSLLPIITLIEDYMKIPKPTNFENLIPFNQGKLLRYVPYWIAQLISLNPTIDIQNVKTLDKSSFRFRSSVRFERWKNNKSTEESWFVGGLGVDFTIIWLGNLPMSFAPFELGGLSISEQYNAFTSLNNIIISDTNKFLQASTAMETLPSPRIR